MSLVSDCTTSQVLKSPLAEKLRPKALNEFTGQHHLLGNGKPLRLAIESGKPHSMILWGPPGTGKTTLAQIMSNAFNAEFISLSAVLSGIKEIRNAIERAQKVLQHNGRHTILFVDEVHRFNKSQQDAFLPHVEQGLFTFVGATTENPSFEVNSALLSRAQVYPLVALTDDDLNQIFKRALENMPNPQQFSDDARKFIIAFADGDARRMINMFEQIITAAEVEKITEIDTQHVQNALSRNTRRFDKGGDEFYDQISALHKSVRGSSPDAALYWLCRMLDSGAEPLYIGRRLIRMAVEDIGMADPRALQIALSACETYERLGSPEGELALAQAALYLSCAPKSNAAYMAYKKTRSYIANDKSRPVPIHLRNAPTQLMKNMGHGRDYRYAHDYPEAYVAGEHYFPDAMPDVQFYQPTRNGLENKIQEKLNYLRSLDQKAKKQKQSRQNR
ncbi:replication-associated recombination protein A [Nitrosomonas aestuarii]|uniref:replication-associated recombination protein A n=1 Tax=Nitrosomonas aestuarii TaxID=52441 RepID=UPI000D2FA618|nr:replication-associated recombination protein A [Nitrosomonas aestuarii]PTN11287.1 recombination protein MgsA [Nitrosomonas aestuarii]